MLVTIEPSEKSVLCVCLHFVCMFECDFTCMLLVRVWIHKLCKYAYVCVLLLCAASVCKLNRSELMRRKEHLLAFEVSDSWLNSVQR